MFRESVHYEFQTVQKELLCFVVGRPRVVNGLERLEDFDLEVERKQALFLIGKKNIERGLVEYFDEFCRKNFQGIEDEFHHSMV